MKINIKLTSKQTIAFKYLTDSSTNEILYGGGAGGGKTYLGCLWILQNCIKYPGTRWLIGRASLKTLKESTLLTFLKICRDCKMIAGEDYKYNSMEGTVKFSNGSDIYLKDLFLYPSDPEFDELGSTEYTGAFIDEASQVTHKAYNIVMSRIRFRLDEYKLIPKILVCTNPTKNFLYAEFYKPAIENKLIDYKKFVPALVGDNPFISKFYIENLNKLDKNSKERLLFGNWEYDDDPARLFEYDRILEIFQRTISPGKRNNAMTVDVARFGQDKTVIVVWTGLQVAKIFSYKEQSLKDTREVIRRLMGEYNVPVNRIIIDEDGVGGGLVDELIGCKGFVNNSRQIQVSANQFKQTNFANLKSQCYFCLADYVNEGKIGISECTLEVKKLIIEDLEQMKRKDADKDGRLQVTPKEEIKENIGRSPDFGDALMMRMLFEIKEPYHPHMA
jgi:phage terminase large subunit